MRHMLFSGVRSMRAGLAQQDARDDFDRARRWANWARLVGWLRGRPSGRNRLPVLGEVMTVPGVAGPGGRRLERKRAGRFGPTSEVMVAIDQIVGTVEPTKCFDRRFRPTSDHPRWRFERVAAEVRSGRGMDPVELYQCGDSYYVLDGHPPHRRGPGTRPALGVGDNHRGPAEPARTTCRAPDLARIFLVAFLTVAGADSTGPHLQDRLATVRVLPAGVQILVFPVFLAGAESL